MPEVWCLEVSAGVVEMLFAGFCAYWREVFINWEPLLDAGGVLFVAQVAVFDAGQLLFVAGDAVFDARAGLFASSSLDLD